MCHLTITTMDNATVHKGFKSRCQNHRLHKQKHMTSWPPRNSKQKFSSPRKQKEIQKHETFLEWFPQPSISQENQQPILFVACAALSPGKYCSSASPWKTAHQPTGASENATNNGKSKASSVGNFLLLHIFDCMTCDAPYWRNTTIQIINWFGSSQTLTLGDRKINKRWGQNLTEVVCSVWVPKRN